MYNNMLYVDDFSDFLLFLIKEDQGDFERYVLGADGYMKIIDILYR